MPTITADIYVKGPLIRKGAIIEYDDENDSIDEDTPFHSGYLQIEFNCLPRGSKPVAKFESGREYWMSLETGSIDPNANEIYFKLDDSYELLNKPIRRE